MLRRLVAIVQPEFDTQVMLLGESYEKKAYKNIHRLRFCIVLHGRYGHC